ncbi:MAG: Meiotic Sister-Chromatid recombination aldehyde dehydrogenase [Alectoria sarmentosa]|nr:MAG: Meiotic Sister-Chromatid recombination aldehyde dehydrogenase [Alectoria sarmentosa]
MDTLNDSPVQLPVVQISIFLLSVVFVSAAFKYIVLDDDEERPVQLEVPVPEQCSPEWKGEVLDEPTIKISESSAIRCYCPANGRLLGLVNPSTPDGIDRAIAKAKEAQSDWAKTTFEQRRRVLKTMLKYILDNQETIATVACLDSGKTKTDASLGEILVTVEKLKWTIQHGEKALRPEKRPTNFLMMYKYNEVRWEPLGVIAACISWNYPFHNFMGPLISTLLTGSALVVKASESTAWSTQYFGSIARAALVSCGHSANLVQPVLCWPQTVSHLTSHPGISHVTFIGSRPIAHHVALSAARSLTPLCLELGGKDPAILLNDIERLGRVASILMRGTFQSAGQNCIGIERIICLHKVYSQLVTILESRIKALRVGSALDDPNDVEVGAMISDARFGQLEKLTSDAIKQGARCLVGGKRFVHPRYPKGHYFQPTLLVDVTTSMRIANEELFAPICVVMRASSLDEAIGIANSTPYALGASVFGKATKDLERVAKEIKAGMISINDFAVYYAVSLPFGGVKGSGYGRFGGEEGLRSICNTKAICRDRFPGLISTSIPPALDYPIEGARRAWEVCKGVVELGRANSPPPTRLHILLSLLRLDPKPSTQRFVETYETKFLNQSTFARKDLDELLGDCQAITDNPFIYFAPELIAACPEVKVILQTRDLDSRYTSSRATIFAFLHDPFINYLCVLDNSMAQWWPVSYKLYYAASGGSHEWGKAIAVHQKLMDKVRELVPKEGLFEWKAQDGWGPLCEFLGEKQREEAFPRVNEGAEFAKLITDIKRDLLTKAAKRAGPWATSLVVVGMGIWWAKKG